LERQRRRQRFSGTCAERDRLIEDYWHRVMATANSDAEISILEEHKMHRAHLSVASLFLAAALAAPLSMMAAPTPQASVQVRVYDRDHKDYHNWDDHENAQWGVFLSDNHRKSHEFTKANRKEQSQYWAWRHSHPD
jgi:hypothetical protein